MKEDCIASTTVASDHPLTSFFPRPFQNHELLIMTGTEKKFPREKLVNKVNHLNFIDGNLSVIFSDRHNRRDIVMKARPQPCLEDKCTCLPAPDGISWEPVKDYQPSFLMIDDGLGAVIAPVELASLNQSALTVKIPKECMIKTQRAVRRRICDNLTCDIRLPDKKYRGILIDFTPKAFSVRLSDGQGVENLDPSETAQIDIFRNSTKLFSGPCRLVRNGLNTPDRRIVYAPLNERIQLFPPRKIRNTRWRTTPSFTIRYRHPFSLEQVERDTFDVSTSGFSIRENPEEQTLMAGMMIPELSIHYAGISEMTCSAQVIYRREDDQGAIVQSGLAITDMDVLSFSRFNHLVGMNFDSNAHVSTTVDMEALWEFFFDTGFIYGEKYQHLYPHRNSFKETYRKLYQDNPEIARHFTYEKNGRIYGHISMIHSYPPTWVIHHFSAKPMESKVPGFLILRQITHYINGYYRFLSHKMDYVMTYYRPENRIVDKIFGGFARELNNPRGSSLDLFSYLHRDKSSAEEQALPAGFTVNPCSAGDLEMLKSYYERVSGGLLLDAFRLDLSMKPLEETFLNAGFKRTCRTFCLRFEEAPLAFFIVNQSDLGLNLSDLLNGITIIVMDEKKSTWKILSSALQTLDSFYETDHIPLLIYPARYAEEHGIRVDKQYQLWILRNDPYSEQYTDYMGRKFRMKYTSTAKE